jgi:hypothetical protein
MRSRAVAIFGVSYAAFLIVGAGLAISAMRLAGWDASYKGSADTIGFVLNVTAFASAVLLALSWRFHTFLGEVAGPLTFRSILSEGRRGLSVKTAVIAVLTDSCLYAFFSWHFTGEMRIPPLHRAAIMAAVYGFSGWIMIGHAVDGRSRDVGR